MKVRIESDIKRDNGLDLKGNPISGYYVTVRIYAAPGETMTKENAQRQNILHHEWLSRFGGVEVKSDG